MLIPLRHENMTARRWPVITITLIVLNTCIFLFTHSSMDEKSKKLGEVKLHLVMLAAMHPELNVPASSQGWVTAAHDKNPGLWDRVRDPNRDVYDGWDARIRTIDDPHALQQEMDSLGAQYDEFSNSSTLEKYGFVPAHIIPISYLTANFLHGGWLHLIGNMWFLWLAGFVLEDNWGRILYSVVYLIAGAAALQFHAWLNPGSMVPLVGASGAVAALMGAFLVRFPKLKIEMRWFLGIRSLLRGGYKFPRPLTGCCRHGCLLSWGAALFLDSPMVWRTGRTSAGSCSERELRCC